MCSETRYRLVVLGSARAGKTSLIRQYLYKDFSDKYRETVEDLHCRQFRIDGITLSLDILDTNVNFPDMRRLAIRTAHAFLLVFAVDDVHSFKQMSDLWAEICDRRLDIGTVPVVIAGNKADILQKKIYFETASSWVSRLQGKVRYVEASAKTDTNVTDIFRNMLELSGFPNNTDKEASQRDAQERRASTSLRRHHSMRARVAGVSNRSKKPSDTPEQIIRKEANFLFRVLSLSPRNRRRLQTCGEQPSNDRMTALRKHSNNLIDQQKRVRLFTWAGDENNQQHDEPANEHEEKTGSERNKRGECGSQLATSQITSLTGGVPERSKHLSLKMRRRRGDADFDESNCKIS